MIYEIVSILTFIIFFTAIFISAFLALTYILTNFATGQARKILGDRNAAVLIFSFGKVFIMSLALFSFFIYSMSFLLRIENNIFHAQRYDRTSETIILSEKSRPTPQEDNVSPPLFDFVIRSADEQNDQKQLTFVLASGGMFALATIIAMGAHIAYLAKNKRYHES